jgi:hypothetical protein
VFGTPQVNRHMTERAGPVDGLLLPHRIYYPVEAAADLCRYGVWIATYACCALRIRGMPYSYLSVCSARARRLQGPLEEDICADHLLGVSVGFAAIVIDAATAHETVGRTRSRRDR